MSSGSSKSGSQNSEPVPDRRSADIGFVCTHRGEMKPFLKRVDRQRSYSEGRITIRGGFLGELVRLVIAEAGVGYAQHRAATELLLDEHHPSWVLCVGFSSALSPDLQAGDLVVANEIADTHGNSLPVKCTIGARKRIHVGKLLVADKHPETPEEKKRFAESSGALAVDTTSLAVAQVCTEKNVRLVVVRAIIDAAEEQVPDNAASMIFRPDSKSVGTAIGSLFRGLRGMSELNNWRIRSAEAASNLDRFVAGLVEQISDIIERRKYGAL
ncbi:MAG: hypothetical protein JNM43_21675 [Planctomycetaceae bacterium]|nr:hypothetical protein [Planctomycetaceae bacterium]